MSQVPLLEAENLSKAYGKTQALSDGGIRLLKGEVHALLGGNGAGKSTLINILGGAKQPDDGQIVINGAKKTFHNPRDAIRNGLAVVYQELSVLPHLSVTENICMGSQKAHSKGIYKWGAARHEARKVLSLLGGPAESIDPDSIVESLRTDQRQMVEIARAVNLGAEIILLDEPTSSLNHEETERLFGVMKKLCSQGKGFIFVSHRLNEIRAICDRVTVIRDGKRVIDGAKLSEIDDTALVSQMSGRQTNKEYRYEQNQSKKGNEHSKSLSELLNIKYEGSKQSIVLQQGEIIGIAGLSGSGRSSLLRNIWGTENRKDIAIQLREQSFKPKNPKQAMKQGIAYVGEDRKKSGVLLDLPLVETLMMPKRLLKPTFVAQESENILAERIIELLKIKTPSLHASPKSMSGGNQQKLLFGRWLTVSPSLLLLDEPTKGVDIATKHDIYQLIHNLVDLGVGVIIISSEISELVTLSNKVVIMKNGCPVKELSDNKINEKTILADMSM